MLKQIELIIEDKSSFSSRKWIGGHAVRVNIINRLKKIDSLSFRKFQIIVSNGKSENSFVDWEDEKNIKIVIFIDYNAIDNCIDIRNIKVLYAMIFQSLSVIWKLKRWDIKSLEKIHDEIIEDNYLVFAKYGKQLYSLNKSLKAKLFCQLLPEYSDFYLRIIEKKNSKVKREIYFFKGYLDPEFFFSFFNNYYWKDNDVFILTDLNKNIFFVFDVIKGAVKIEYSINHNSIQNHKEFLRAFQFDTPDKERRLLLGFKE